MNTETTQSPPMVASAALLDDRPTFDFDFRARPQPTDSYYARNCRDSVSVVISAPTREDAEKLALVALGSCESGHMWEFKLRSVRNSSNAEAIHGEKGATK